VYDHSRKGLVATDIGPVLRHEFFHAMHWRAMERTGHRHPVWIREGLAALVEDIDADADALRVLPSWRTNIARRLADVRRLRPWDRFVELTPERFARTRPLSNYAQARALFHWLRDTNRLGAWYEAYARSIDEDPNGLAAVGEVTEHDTDDWSRELRAWLAKQPEIGVPGEGDPVGLGVRLRPGNGDGPVVDEVGVTGLRGERLRPRDVIRAVDDEPVRTMHELYRVLGEREAGDTVTVRAVRGRRVVEVRMRLVREDELFWMR